MKNRPQNDSSFCFGRRKNLPNEVFLIFWALHKIFDFFKISFLRWSGPLKNTKYNEKYIEIGIFVSNNSHSCTFESKVRIDCLVDRKNTAPKFLDLFLRSAQFSMNFYSL